MYTLSRAKFHPLLLIIFSSLGALASLYYSLEILYIAQNPDIIPSCTLNSVVNCLATMNSSQSTVFGIPNSFIGLAMYMAALGYGVAWYFVETLPTTLKNIVFAFSIFGLIFSVYLMIIGLSLGVICPICLTSFLAGTNIFFTLLSEKVNVKYFWSYVLSWHILFFTSLGIFYIYNI